jgi:hypothetical protein
MQSGQSHDNMMTDTFLTGEKIQMVCDAWCGTAEAFKTNPRLRHHLHKQICLEKLESSEGGRTGEEKERAKWENPRVLFCFGNRLDLLCVCLSRNIITRPFVLVTHNSDANIHFAQQDSPCVVTYVLNHPLLIRWHAQNCGIDHPRMHPLPIGIANSMWPHGNLNSLALRSHNHRLKGAAAGAAGAGIGDGYLGFNIHTNPKARTPCAEKLTAKGYKWHPPDLPYERYLDQLAGHVYAFCPEGNGWDTHRMWECIHLGVVPVVLDTPFVRILEKYVLPKSLCIIPSWDSFEPSRHAWKEFRTVHNDTTLRFRISNDFFAAHIHTQEP